MEKIIYNSAGSSPDIKELLNADGRGRNPFPGGGGSAAGSRTAGSVPRAAARGRGGAAAAGGARGSGTAGPGGFVVLGVNYFGG